MTVNTITAPAVRTRQCPLCETPPGEPCQPKPSGDHLARYLDAYTAGHLTKAYMAAVLGELVVIDGCTVVAAAPESAAGDPEGWCRTCGARAGHFLGLTGPRHFRGEGTAASPVELTDPGHAPVMAWRYPDGAL